MNMNFSGFWPAISTLLALAVFLLFSAYPFFIWKTLANGNENDEEFQEKWVKTYEVFKDKESSKFQSVILGRKYFFSIAMVLF